METRYKPQHAINANISILGKFLHRYWTAYRYELPGAIGRARRQTETDSPISTRSWGKPHEELKRDGTQEVMACSTMPDQSLSSEQKFRSFGLVLS
jgi:hypothetical protein